MINLRKFCKLFVCMNITFQSLAFCSENEATSIHPPIFVSLGKDCHIADNLRIHQLRTEAYPLDWLLTLNDDNLVNLLNYDFYLFLDRRFLISNQFYVRNTLYQIDFWHDWPSGKLDEFFDAVKDKYDRRIQRFKDLNSYQGKVFFIRGASSNPKQHHNINEVEPLWYQSVHTEHPNIDQLHAKKLKEVLDRKFPDLDFTLVIVNFIEYLNPDEEIKGLDNVVEFQIRMTQMTEDFGHISESLK